MHIEQLNYRLEQFNLHEIHFSELSFVHKAEASQQSIHLHDIHIKWQLKLWFSPRIISVIIDRAQLDHLQLTSSSEAVTPRDDSSPAFSLPENWSIPTIFPSRIHVQTLVISLPCHTGTCSLAGVADVFKIKTDITASGVSLNLRASPGTELLPEHQLELRTLLDVQQNLPKLETKLTVGQNLDLQFTTSLLQTNETHWIGNVEASATYPDEWWLKHLQDWNIQFEQHADKSQPLSLKSEWDILLAPLQKLPANTSISKWKKAFTGAFSTNIKITAPIQILDFGKFSGQTKLSFATTAGELNRYELNGDVSAEDVKIPESLQAMGLTSETLHIKIHSGLADKVNLNSLPAEFSISAKGSMQGDVTGRLLVDTVAKKITLEQLSAATKIKQLKPAKAVQLDNTELNLHARGYLQTDKFAISITEPSQFLSDVTVPSLSMQAKSANLKTTQLNITGDIAQHEINWRTLRIESEATLSMEKLMHPQLIANTWGWQGQAQGNIDNFDITGKISVGTSLNVKHHIKRENSELNVDWKIPDIFLLAANPFRDTFKAWPPLLTLSRGKINANGNLIFNIEKNSLTKSGSDIELMDVAGIYDTSVFQGVNSKAKVIADAKTLQITTTEIKVDQIDKGFKIGPLNAAGKYKASWNKPTQGKLTVQHFYGTLMEGRVTSNPQEFDFSKEAQRATLTLENINLTTLLSQYPSSELSGSGQLSGNIPIEISSKGIRIEQGMVAAQSPGGKLKYQSPRANELAKTQPGVKLITDALEDFHYSVLATQVNYDESGKLLLGVKLEGKNPALENGRPINFNVNLEEDVPAMLASIQLSSKVTDIVKKRVQERLQEKKQPETTP